MTTIQSLYESRCTVRDGKLVPTFWKPEPIKAIDTTEETTIQKLIAAGLVLELEVGKFVREELEQNKVLGRNPTLYKLLMSNIADEARHEEGFRYANAVLPSFEFIRDAEQLKQGAQDIAKTYSDLAVAALLEVGVFLPSLAIMRMFGGYELGMMATKIALDESRHTSVNYQVCAKLGDPIPQINKSQKVKDFVNSCLEFLFSDLSAESQGIKIDLKLIKEESLNLLETGESLILDRLAGQSQFVAPFEVENRIMYDRNL